MPKDDDLTRDVLGVIDIIENLGQALIATSDPRKAYTDEAHRLADAQVAYQEAVHRLAQLRRRIEARAERK